MSRIRHLAIRRFRGISHLDWAPRAGINALLGVGDVGKSTVLDAIGLAMSGTRREVFYDTDFHDLDSDAGFEIKVTLGELPPELHDLERYGEYLRGWDAATSQLQDEPAAALEDVLTLRLQVDADLEGRWSLYSDRSQDRDPRDLISAHRALIAPIALGDQSPATHLRWSRQSILQRLATPQFAMRTLVAQAARGLRQQAEDVEDPAVTEVLAQVQQSGQDLGIRKAQGARVQLDAFGIPGWNASLALHDEDGVPLRRLGNGSARLLVAGLFQSRIAPGGIALIDEAEHGLEPHRIARLLRMLGAGTMTGSQVFLTTHSPVVVRELSASELGIVQYDAPLEAHSIQAVDARFQGTVRTHAEAFLSVAILVCEGPTEVGLIRGLDEYWLAQGLEPLAFQSIAVADGQGIPQSGPRASAFAQLGYRTALLMDDDRPFTPEEGAPVDAAGVQIISWGAGQATEDALFAGMAWADVVRLMTFAEEIYDRQTLDMGVRTHNNGLTLDACLADDQAAHRRALGLAAKQQGWFKRIDFGERVGRDVLGPGLARAGEGLQNTVAQIRAWIDVG